jgi:hypothetical protein
MFCDLGRRPQIAAGKVRCDWCSTATRLPITECSPTNPAPDSMWRHGMLVALSKTKPVIDKLHAEVKAVLACRK